MHYRFLGIIMLCSGILFLDAGVWSPDLGDGTYQNPVLFADYSDPDVIRVGNDYYMVASSFNCVPGIPVLHSRDLVNWTIIGHVYERLPFEKYNKPVHGEGSWAPSIRYHEGYFYVYFCTPHEGLFMAKTADPAGSWNLHHVTRVEMWEDPCPLWDDDGNAYLVRSKLCGQPMIVHRMSWDGKTLLDNGTVVFDDPDTQPVLEGPKFLKKDGWYYIIAPAGGVPGGWQTVLRSRNVYGPYEAKIVLHQGDTEINGPHQGGLVDTQTGAWWFIHFQDRQAYGRIVHLQPARWEAGWPLLGVDQNNDGIGEPVISHRKPDIPFPVEVCIPQTSDEFELSQIAPQWQWHANFRPEWFSLTERPGNLRLFAVQNLSQGGNFWFVANLLLQKFPAPAFQVSTRIEFHPDSEGDLSGLCIMGETWSTLAVEKKENTIRVGQYTGSFNQCNDLTNIEESIIIDTNNVFMRVIINSNASCIFSYSLDGLNYQTIGTLFHAKKGRWIGAKVGLFCLNPNMMPSHGFADFDWFRIE
jgi:beta-xylosidase